MRILNLWISHMDFSERGITNFKSSKLKDCGKDFNVPVMITSIGNIFNYYKLML